MEESKRRRRRGDKKYLTPSRPPPPPFSPLLPSDKTTDVTGLFTNETEKTTLHYLNENRKEILTWCYDYPHYWHCYFPICLPVCISVYPGNCIYLSFPMPFNLPIFISLYLCNCLSIYRRISMLVSLTMPFLPINISLPV